MNLTLEIIAPRSALMGAGSRKVFDSAGGVIGRVGGMPGDRRDAWILPHTKVSKEHARISWVDGAFYIEDTSRNGVGLNSSKNRLAKGRPYPLKSGDRLFIDPYEISVSVESQAYQPYEEIRRPLDVPVFSRDELGLEDEVDPLNLLDPRPAATAATESADRRRTEYRFAVGRALQAARRRASPASDATSEAFIGADARRVQPVGTRGDRA